MIKQTLYPAILEDLKQMPFSHYFIFGCGGRINGTNFEYITMQLDKFHVLTMGHMRSLISVCDKHKLKFSILSDNNIIIRKR